MGKVHHKREIQVVKDGPSVGDRGSMSGEDTSRERNIGSKGWVICLR